MEKRRDSPVPPRAPERRGWPSSPVQIHYFDPGETYAWIILLVGFSEDSIMNRIRTSSPDATPRPPDLPEPLVIPADKVDRQPVVVRTSARRGHREWVSAFKVSSIEPLLSKSRTIGGSDSGSEPIPMSNVNDCFRVGSKVRPDIHGVSCGLKTLSRQVKADRWIVFCGVGMTTNPLFGGRIHDFL